MPEQLGSAPENLIAAVLAQASHAPSTDAVAAVYDERPMSDGESNRRIARIATYRPAVNGAGGNNYTCATGCEIAREGGTFEQQVDALAALPVDTITDKPAEWSRSELERIITRARKEVAQERVNEFDVVIEPDQSQPGGPRIVSADNISDATPECISENWLYRGILTLLAALPGLGKSTVARRHLAELTLQGYFVLFVGPEEPDAVIKRGMESAGADPQKWAIVRIALAPRKGVLQEIDVRGSEEGLRYLADAVEQTGADIVVCDALSDMLPDDANENSNAETRAVLKRLLAVAEQYGFALLGLVHYNKNSKDAGGADDRIISSRAYSALARIIWHILLDPNEKDRRLLLPSKFSYTERPPGQAFRIVGVPYRGNIDDSIAHVEWESEPLDMNADDGLRALASAADTRGKSTRESAQSTITTFLASHQWRDYRDLLLAGQVAGIHTTTFQAAIRDLRSTGEIEVDRIRNPQKIRLTDLPPGREPINKLELGLSQRQPAQIAEA